MPTNKQRREAARRKLERQLQARQERARRRRQANLIASIVGAVVIVAVVIGFIAFTSRDKSSSAAATGSTSPSTSPSSSRAPLPVRKPSGAISRAVKKTNGPCGYSEAAAGLKSGRLFDVGLPPDPTPTPKKNHTATFTTNQGVVTVELTGATAPCNVQSLVYLIGQKFFDRTACPRSVNQGIFVVQCGDPSGSTGGGPTYSVKDENLKNAKYPAGSIAMANSGPNSNGSQFFFITKDSTQALGPKYTVVGKVTKGLDVLQKVAAAGDDGSNQAGGGRPNRDLIFNTVRATP
ncbi:MAG: peptidylprolyl isomerase [Actinomycetota bacterium]|nr:peptidylprolyl isomerase [Actinomycetota bacterium]